MLIGFSSLLNQDQWSLFHKPTRMHSSRMCTARLPTVRASVVATRCQSVLGEGAVQWGPVNKFEQVSSDGHQMSLVGGMVRGSPCPMSGGGAGLWGLGLGGEEVSMSHVWGRGQAKGALYTEVECMMHNGHMRTPMWTE